MSNLNGTDLQELLWQLKYYYVEYQDNLSFNENVSIGVEIEFEKIKNINDIICYFYDLKLNLDWDIKNDSTLIHGKEINSPILFGSKETWDDLKKVCKFVRRHGDIGNRSGGHIHIGAHLFDCNVLYLLNFIKLWTVYENVLFRYLYGDFLTYRDSITSFAYPIADKLNNICNNFNISSDFRSLLQELSNDRYMAVNFDNIKSNKRFDKKIVERNTIEFRSPNGSCEEVIWQNNINALVNLVLYSTNSNFDMDIINKRGSEVKNIYSDIHLYSEIFLEQALELCDLIFNNNLDKINFLRQYLKNYQISNKVMKKTKNFIKK